MSRPRHDKGLPSRLMTHETSRSTLKQAPVYPDVLELQSKPSFVRVDQVKESFDCSEVMLNVIEDVYQRDFLPQAHFNFACFPEGGNSPFVVSVNRFMNKGGKPGRYAALITTERNYEELELMITGQPTEDVVVEVLSNHPQINCKDIVLIDDPTFPATFSTLEVKHCQKRTQMKLAIVCCKQGQTTAPEMFSNSEDDCSPAFWNFVSLLGTQIDLEGWAYYRGDMRPPGFTYYSLWNDIEVIYHVAPLLNAEEQRRLIGNDIAMLFFFDEPDTSATFSLAGLDSFGDVPHVYAVIQPCGNTGNFRTAFFSKSNIDVHNPCTPQGALNDRTTKAIVLTKLYNGLVMTTYCPPLNRLFFLPRRATLTSIVEKFQKTGEQQKRGGLLNILRTQTLFQRDVIEDYSLHPEDVLEQIKNLIGDTDIDLDENCSMFSSNNALALLLTCHLSYFSPEDAVRYGPVIVNVPPIGIYAIKSNETIVVICCDQDRMMISFRSLLSVDKLKKTLPLGVKGVGLQLKKFNLRFHGNVVSNWHKGFLSVWPQLHEALIQCYEGQKVFISGHSIGGCLATLAGQVLHSLNFDVCGVYTFGSPAVGDTAWKDSYSTVLHECTYRITHAEDTLQHAFLGNEWVHVGTATPVSQKPGKIVLGYDDPEEEASVHQIGSYLIALFNFHNSAAGRNSIALTSRKFIRPSLFSSADLASILSKAPLDSSEDARREESFRDTYDENIDSVEIRPRGRPVTAAPPLLLSGNSKLGPYRPVNRLKKISTSHPTTDSVFEGANEQQEVQEQEYPQPQKKPSRPFQKIPDALPILEGGLRPRYQSVLDELVVLVKKGDNNEVHRMSLAPGPPRLTLKLQNEQYLELMKEMERAEPEDKSESPPPPSHEPCNPTTVTTTTTTATITTPLSHVERSAAGRLTITTDSLDEQIDDLLEMLQSEPPSPIHTTPLDPDISVDTTVSPSVSPPASPTSNNSHSTLPPSPPQTSPTPTSPSTTILSPTPSPSPAPHSRLISFPRGT
eukprot:TRINITY_DN2281_c0_g1_i3.p1 TRINITY_DN2281_c0_g1~~TRINITY_DN2281_c0_g1_i3.p1  ORF type:complete len:1014 (-),score=165.02 TRINITY_DN2281_c0_g1_i3:10-3051(-)